MGAYPNDRSNDPRAAITYGRDFNFFAKVTVTSGSFNTDADVIITFPTQGLLLLNEDSTSVVQVSFNGNTVHDELNPALPSKGISYDDRVVSKIWFKIESGSSAVISIRAWGIR